MPASVARRPLLLAGLASAAGWRTASAAVEQLHIGAPRGTLDFSIGDLWLFRTTGTFKSWDGTVQIDDDDAANSSVVVIVRTASIQMLDPQQTNMLKDRDFFDVENFPQMIFRSGPIERSGETMLKVGGSITLRGVTQPMVFDMSMTGRRPDAAAGARYARFKGTGMLRRSEFGMTKYVDMVGDKVAIAIRTDAWR